MLLNCSTRLNRYIGLFFLQQQWCTSTYIYCTHVHKAVAWIHSRLFYFYLLPLHILWIMRTRIIALWCKADFKISTLHKKPWSLKHFTVKRLYIGLSTNVSVSTAAKVIHEYQGIKTGGKNATLDVTRMHDKLNISAFLMIANIIDFIKKHQQCYNISGGHFRE